MKTSCLFVLIIILLYGCKSDKENPCKSETNTNITKMYDVSLDRCTRIHIELSLKLKNPEKRSEIKSLRTTVFNLEVHMTELFDLISSIIDIEEINKQIGRINEIISDFEKSDNINNLAKIEPIKLLKNVNCLNSDIENLAFESLIAYNHFMNKIRDNIEIHY